MTTRPPKPPDRESAPRTKKKAPRPAGVAGHDAARSALQRFSDAEPEASEIARLRREIETEKSDRAAAILIATTLERVLEYAIARHLKLEGPSKDLFGFNSPIGTFNFKIRIGNALGIFGDEMRRDLDMIRSIRNAFAHSQRPINFSDVPVKNACALLRFQKLLPPVARPRDWRPETPKELDAIQGRKRFVRICDELIHNLLMWPLYSRMPISPDAMPNVLLLDGYEVWAIRRPLP
jgi:hypothetical protein